MMKTLCSIILFGALASLLSGQDVGSSGKLIRTMGWGKGQPDLYYRDGAEYLRLHLSAGTISGYHSYSGSSAMGVYIESTDPATGEPSYSPFLEVELLKGVDQQLLVFVPTPGNPDKLRAFAYDDSMEAFGEQDLLIFNFSPLPLAFQINGEERFPLKPGQSYIFSGGGKPHARVEIAAFRKDEWSVEYRATPRLRKGYRNFFFFRDVEELARAGSGIEPIVFNERIASIRAAIANPDGNSSSGEISGSVTPFNADAFDD